MPVVVTGVADVTSNNFIDIYPNPATTNLTIEIQNTGTKNQDASVKIFNALGQKLYSSLTKNSKTEIDISGYASGIYFVEIKTNGNTIVKKVSVIK